MYRFAKQQSPFIIYYYYFPPARHVEQDEKKDTGVFFLFFLKILKLPSKKSILDIDVTLTRILPVCTFIFPLRLLV